MKRVFADSFYFIALLNEGDAAHARAFGLSKANRGEVVTTRSVLVELADAMCDPVWRARAGAFISRAIEDGFTVIENSDALFDRGLELYRRRADKEWSLTDCISFLVMSDQGITEALTGDHHFEQAGFTALLR